MKNFAPEYVMYEDDAEDIVQDVFMELYSWLPKQENVNDRQMIVAESGPNLIFSLIFLNDNNIL